MGERLYEMDGEVQTPTPRFGAYVGGACGWRNHGDAGTVDNPKLHGVVPARASSAGHEHKRQLQRLPKVPHGNLYIGSYPVEPEQAHLPERLGTRGLTDETVANLGKWHVRALRS